MGAKAFLVVLGIGILLAIGLMLVVWLVAGTLKDEEDIHTK